MTLRTLMCLLLSLGLEAQGQGTWSSFGSGLPLRVSALTSFDDGAGPRLFAAGTFSTINGQPTSGIARFDGAAWAGFGNGLSPGTAIAFGRFDAGSGPSLIAGGTFAGSIARLDVATSSWLPLGLGLSGGFPASSVIDMIEHDDGSGWALFVVGSFLQAAGLPAPLVAKWTGTSWSPLSSGLSTGFFDTGRALAIFDEGQGPRLFVAGIFQTAGGIAASNIARWDGSNFSPVGTGLNGGVSDLAVFDDGSGPQLFAIGSFTTAGASPAPGAARWNGSSWSPLMAPPFGSLTKLAVYDPGFGRALYAGRININFGASLPALLTWTPGGWLVDATGTVPTTSLSFGISALGVHDLGAGPRLVVGGEFTSLNGVSAAQIAQHTGTASLAMEVAQPGGPGTPFRFINTNLTPGRTYFNIFSTDLCAAGPGTGPATFFGLCSNNIGFVVTQLMLPSGTVPYHFLATESHHSFGPSVITPVTVDAICFDATGGILGTTSLIRRLTVQ